MYKALDTEKEIYKIVGNNSYNFNHIDFIFAKDIDFLHKPLFKVIKKLSR